MFIFSLEKLYNVAIHVWKKQRGRWVSFIPELDNIKINHAIQLSTHNLVLQLAMRKR